MEETGQNSRYKVQALSDLAVSPESPVNVLDELDELNIRHAYSLDSYTMRGTAKPSKPKERTQINCS